MGIFWDQQMLLALLLFLPRHPAQVALPALLPGALCIFASRPQFFGKVIAPSRKSVLPCEFLSIHLSPVPTGGMVVGMMGYRASRHANNLPNCIL